VLSLLVKDTGKRLGCGREGADEIKAHRFWRSVDWERLRNKELPPPWRPKVTSALDTSHFDDYDESPDETPYTDDGSKWDAAF